MSQDLFFAVAQAAVVSLLAGAVFWLVLRNFRGVAPNIHRYVWFGVLLLGLCVLRWPVDIPFYEPEPEPLPVVANVRVQEEINVATENIAIPEKTIRELPPTFMPQHVPQFEPQNIPKYEPQPIVVPNNESAHEPGTVFPEIITGVWLAGVLVLLVRRLILFVQLHLRLRSLQKGAAPDWERLLVQFGVAPEKIPVLWTDNAGPALVRIWGGYRLLNPESQIPARQRIKYCLLFPKSLWDELSPTHRDGVLRHELSHYLHGDAAVMELARLLVTLQWFNPISWVALRKLEEATEWRCDDFAYFNRESGPQELIETLLAVHDSTESLGLYLSSFARINVIHRINRLLHTNSRKENTLMKKTILLALFLTFLLAGVLQIHLVAKPQTEVKEKATQQNDTTESLELYQKHVELAEKNFEELKELQKKAFAAAAKKPGFAVVTQRDLEDAQARVLEAKTTLSMHLVYREDSKPEVVARERQNLETYYGQLRDIAREQFKHAQIMLEKKAATDADVRVAEQKYLDAQKVLDMTILDNNPPVFSRRMPVTDQDPAQKRQILEQNVKQAEQDFGLIAGYHQTGNRHGTNANLARARLEVLECRIALAEFLREQTSMQAEKDAITKQLETLYKDAFIAAKVLYMGMDAMYAMGRATPDEFKQAEAQFKTAKENLLKLVPNANPDQIKVDLADGEMYKEWYGDLPKDETSEKQQPALAPETQKLITLAESMVTQADVTAEQLHDLAEDLIAKTHVDPPVSRDVYKAIIGLCDKIIAQEPELKTLLWAYENKHRMLNQQAYAWYSDETIQALKDFASETAHADYASVKNCREYASDAVLSLKIWRLVRPETKTTADMFQNVQTELVEYFRTVKSPGSYLAESLVDVASQLHDRKVITKEQWYQAFETAIKLLRESPGVGEEYTQRIRINLENTLALMQAEGKKPEITGTDMNGQPFDWNAYKGKNVLMAFTSSWSGGREMQDMLVLAESFSGHGLEFVTYVSLNGTNDKVDESQEEQWLRLCVEKLDYPGKVLTQIESPEPSVKGIVQWLGERSYSSKQPHFMLVDENGQIVTIGRTNEMRAYLTGRFGKPSDEAVARGLERSKAYLTAPKPCVSNFRELALAVHMYYDVNQTMPPAYTIDEKGNKLHSWRVLLLPYLGYEELYSQIRLDEPWDSEHNKKIGETIVPVFQCHLAAFGPNPQPVTTYAAIVGREGVFEENGKQVGFIDIADGMSNTVLFVERATPVNWMDPSDITFDEAIKGIGVSPNGIAAAHDGGSNCAFCDGSTRFLPKDIDLKVLRAIITRDGGESVSFPE